MVRQGKRTLAAAFLAVLAAGLATPGSDAASTRNLWATVNICNTQNHPNELGVRGSMPGNSTRQRMFMRFHAQYYNQATKRWFDVKGIHVTPWQFVGLARAKSRQSGYTFSFPAPPAGKSFLLRGAVDFQWRALRHRHGHRRMVVVRRARAFTSGQHAAPGADPPGYSSGTCELRSQ